MESQTTPKIHYGDNDRLEQGYERGITIVYDFERWYDGEFPDGIGNGHGGAYHQDDVQAAFYAGFIAGMDTAQRHIDLKPEGDNGTQSTDVTQNESTEGTGNASSSENRI